MADGMGRQGPEDGGEGDAAQAFEALRAEVAALRRGVELIYRGQQDAAGSAGLAPVDYSPTLGGMAKTLQAVEGRPLAIEGNPAMALTPARFEGELESAVRGAAAVAGDELRRAVQRAGAAAADLEGLVGRVRGEQEQSVWLSVAGLSGFGLGALLWLLLAAVLPWGVGHRMAASLVGGGGWEAGATLMREAKPAAWDRVLQLSQACPPETLIDLCEAAMVVRTIPPGPAAQPISEGAKTLAPPTVAPGSPPARGRVGGGALSGETGQDIRQTFLLRLGLACHGLKISLIARLGIHYCALLQPVVQAEQTSGDPFVTKVKSVCQELSPARICQHAG